MPIRRKTRRVSSPAPTEFDALSQREHGRPFLKLEPAQRLALVQSVHDAATKAELQLALPVSQLHRPFILMTKEFALLGFFTSKVGATQVL